MKKIFLLLFAIWLAPAVFAQENFCESGYMPHKPNFFYELTSYDKKGKAVSIARHKIINRESLPGGFSATVQIDIVDEKGKSEHQGAYKMECRDGVFYMDIRSMMDPRSMQGLSDMEMEISGDELQIPSRMEVGDALPDGTIIMKASANGMALMTFSMAIRNRKVEARETVTTPAGTFDCLKLSQESEMKSIVKKTVKSTTWYAKGIGMVKTENYDSKGQVESATVLTKYSE
jgi:hypothetical protein